MKHLLSLLLIIPITLYSEDETELKLLKRASEINGVDLADVAQIELKKKVKVLNLDKVEKADAILLETKIKLLSQAKMDLHHDLTIHRVQEKLKREAKTQELVIASAWQNSRTGRIDGRSWFDLYEEERRSYRELYFDFHKK